MGSRLEGGIDGIADEIDQQLLQLIAIGRQGYVLTVRDFYCNRVSKAATRRINDPIMTGWRRGGGSRASRV